MDDMTSLTQSHHRADHHHMLSKVPEVTAVFWVIKVLCTTVGETAADYLNTNLSLGLTNTTFITASALDELCHGVRRCSRRASGWGGRGRG